VGVSVTTTWNVRVVAAAAAGVAVGLGGCVNPSVTLSSVSGTPVSWNVVSDGNGAVPWEPGVVSCAVVLPHVVGDPLPEWGYVLVVTDTETGAELWRRDLDQQPMRRSWPPLAGATSWVWDGERLRQETDEDRPFTFVQDGDTCD
jgi:hypothetical protein